jgi:NH3-dependent NAD+ synthetase
MDPRLKALVEWIRRTAAPAKGLLVPVSGGSDSALGFWLCMLAFPGKTIAVHAGGNLRRQDWFTSVGPVAFVETPGDFKEREEMRWARFLALSLERRYWLVGSRNRTEDLLGTYSLSSRLATFLPLVGTWKSDVMALSEIIGVPRDILDSSRRADPDCGRPSELAEIPFETVESYLKTVFSEWGPTPDRTDLTPEQQAYLNRVLDANAFKAHLPIRGPKP